mgnify:CR=1 FL=1|jgi:hypothetical protein
MDLQDIRDWIVVVAVIVLSLALFVVLLICAFVGYKTWRGVRALNRLNDEQLRERLIGFNERFREWIEADVFTLSGLTAAGIGGLRRVQARRKPKRRRLRALGEALGGARERLPFGR